ncbi:Transcription elongation factor GreA [bacterium AB1]|nr:Transcription elongation factor GreA [bacterium AB1]
MEKITRKRYIELLKELNDLKQNIIPNIKIKIEDARKNGDFSENAELQSELRNKVEKEYKYNKISEILSNSEVIDFSDTEKNDKVQLGSKVEVNINDVVQTYCIVCQYDTDLKNGKIYYNSPLAKQLIGKKIGDVFLFLNREYKILNIDFDQ